MNGFVITPHQLENSRRAEGQARLIPLCTKFEGIWGLIKDKMYDHEVAVTHSKIYVHSNLTGLHGGVGVGIEKSFTAKIFQRPPYRGHYPEREEGRMSRDFQGRGELERQLYMSLQCYSAA